MSKHQRTACILVVATALVGGCQAAQPGPGRSPVAPAATNSGPPAESLPATPPPMASADATSPSLTPPPSSTPSPSVAAAATPGNLERVATVERDGIRVRIELQRNPLPAGEPSWVRVTVTNTGRNEVTWLHDGCALAAWVGGESLVAWAEGADLPQQAQRFKQYALGTYVGPPLPPARLAFVPRKMLGTGSYGCADIGISEYIKPGKHIRQTLWWTGFTDVNRALPPTGPARITATASYYWRGRKEPARIADQSLDLALGAWISGGTDAGRLSPAQIIDAAVADPAFAGYLETQELANGREEIAWYDAAHGVWEVGVMPWYETTPPRIHGVLVDPVAGEIRGVLDRAWNEQADGFP